MEVSESTLPTNEEIWWYLCVSVCVCVVNSAGGTGVYSHSSFTGYCSVFCLHTVVWMLILWLTAIVMQSHLSLRLHIYIYFWLCSPSSFCFYLLWLRNNNLNNLKLVLNHFFISSGIFPLSTVETWIYWKSEVRCESLTELMVGYVMSTTPYQSACFSWVF